jgi:hypothetical protein
MSINIFSHAKFFYSKYTNETFKALAQIFVLMMMDIKLNCYEQNKVSSIRQCTAKAKGGKY